jgi:methionyl-tRNA synthetase
MVGRMNGDLANDYGNLAQRVLSMMHKNCDGAIAAPGDLAEADRKLLDETYALPDRVRPLMDDQGFHKALATIWEIVSAANRYVDEQAPWVLRKEDPARMATVLWTLAECLRNLAILTQPFMPQSSAKLLDLLVVDEGARDFAHLGADQALAPGTAIPKPQGVFPRYVEQDDAA